MKLPQVHALGRLERGASLLVALVFLVVMATLGTTLASVSNLEERMASNTRDRDLALQSAEAALVDAAASIKNNAAVRAAATAFVATNANSAAYWETCFTTPVAPCTATYTPAQALPTSGPAAVAAQPKYVVQSLPSAGPQAYIVTARGVGRTTSTVVVLQAVFDYT